MTSLVASMYETTISLLLTLLPLEQPSIQYQLLIAIINEPALAPFLSRFIVPYALGTEELKRMFTAGFLHLSHRLRVFVHLQTGLNAADPSSAIPPKPDTRTFPNQSFPSINSSTWWDGKPKQNFRSSSSLY